MIAQNLVYIAIFLSYLLVGFTVYRWLWLRLQPFARWLALVFLTAQIVAIVMSGATASSSGLAYWLWHLDMEWNIPSALASMQLALVGAVAILVAWLWIKPPAWQRLYFVGIAIVFLFFAYDEFATIHEGTPHWRSYYRVIGLGIVLSSALLALRNLRTSWVWLFCLPLGLAIGGFGATVLDISTPQCGGQGAAYLLGECVQVLVLEESLEFLGIWLALVAILGHLSGISPAPKVYLRALLFAVPVLWMIFLSQRNVISPVSTQVNAIEFENGVWLHRHKVDTTRPDRVRARLHLSGGGWKFSGLGYSISLLDRERMTVIASRDRFAHERLEFKLAPGYVPAYLQVIDLEIPPETPPNRLILIVLTIWRQENGEFIRQKILSTDQPQLSDTQLVLGEMVIQSDSGPPSATTLATFDNGFALEAVELPACLEPGDTVDVNFAWRANSAGSEDFAQFLHFIHAESGAMWNHDQLPLGSRLPTRLWYSGLADSEMWRFSLPADLPTGEYSLFTGLYRHSDLERVGAHSPDGSMFPDARIPIGNMPVQMAC